VRVYRDGRWHIQEFQQQLESATAPKRGVRTPRLFMMPFGF